MAIGWPTSGPVDLPLGAYEDARESRLRSRRGGRAHVAVWFGRTRTYGMENDWNCKAMMMVTVILAVQEGIHLILDLCRKEMGSVQERDGVRTRRVHHDQITTAASSKVIRKESQRGGENANQTIFATEETKKNSAGKNSRAYTTSVSFTLQRKLQKSHHGLLPKAPTSPPPDDNPSSSSSYLSM